MSTRFYLPASAEATGISPTPNGNWEDTTQPWTRAVLRTTKKGDPLVTVSITDANASDWDVLFRQYVSAPLTPGQTITGSQAIKAQCRVKQGAATNNMFFAVYIGVWNGTTVNLNALSVTRDTVNEADPTTLTNRQFTATSVAGNYTTVVGDRLVIEIGMGGDPTAGSSHGSDMRLGDSAASDLAENDTATSDDNPWVELADTLTFQVEIDVGYPVNHRR